MDILLDTHVAIWAFDDSPKLSSAARDIIADAGNRIFVSDISVWEVAIKHVAHPEKVPYDAQRFVKLCNRSGFISLSMTLRDVFTFEKLDVTAASATHKDPFDRILIAQAKESRMLFLTHDRKLSLYHEPLVAIV